MTRIYLLRHGETDWNAEGNRYCGHSDVPLSDRGHAQAALAASALAGRGLAAIVSSPLRRGRETARAIASDGAERVVDERLLEIDFGSWEGLTREEIGRADAAGWAAWTSDPGNARAGGAETGAEVARRAAAAMDDLAALYPGRELAVVGHNTLNRLFLAAAMAAPLAAYRRLAQANGCINVVDLGAEGWRLELLNGSAHLGGQPG